MFIMISLLLLINIDNRINKEFTNSLFTTGKYFY